MFNKFKQKQEDLIWYMLADSKFEEVLKAVKNLKACGNFSTYGHLIFDMAAQFNCLAIIKYLVEDKKLDINMKNQAGMTALHSASFHNNIKIVEYLLKHGADVNIKNNSGDTPLTLAIEHADRDVLKILLDNNADSNYVHPYFGALPEILKRAGRLDLLLDLRDKE